MQAGKGWKKRGNRGYLEVVKGEARTSPWVYQNDIVTPA
ncbi:hypothetical protein BN132_808 [Cronobacter turicensis 564]|nr:hypothetical protein BN132_808 [Cronobacter turicensis 564]